MSDLIFKSGVFGKESTRHNVAGVRVLSEPWAIDGVELISIAVDYADGKSETLVAIQSDFDRI